MKLLLLRKSWKLLGCDELELLLSLFVLLLRSLFEVEKLEFISYSSFFKILEAPDCGDVTLEGFMISGKNNEAKSSILSLDESMAFGDCCEYICRCGLEIDRT